MPTVAERFARHVVATRSEHLPADAAVAAKRLILDALAAGVAGSSHTLSASIAAAAAGWGGGAEATVLGSGRRLAAPAAALVNGFQVHCLEFDPLHEAAVIHALSVPLAASFAWAERRGGVRGRDLLLALALGVDIAVALGLAAKGPWRFFRPAIAGGFGAVAAIGKLAGFDERRLVDAFGITYAQACGTMQAHSEGKPVLPLQIGFNARNAVAAADLAAAGIAGTVESFEGRFGYLPLFEGEWALGPVLGALGQVWRIAELSQKPFPCGRATHGAIDGLLRLKERHGFTADDVVEATLHGSALVHQLVSRPDMADPPPNHARLCLAYVAAVALRQGSVGLDDFTAERLGDPAVHALASRIRVEPDERIAHGALLPQRLAVRLRDGSVHELAVETVLGHPDRPLDRARHLDKLRRCWRAAGLGEDRAAQAIEAGDSLEMLESCDELMALAAPDQRMRK